MSKPETTLERAERALADAYDSATPPNLEAAALIGLAAFNRGADPSRASDQGAAVIFVTLDAKTGYCAPQPLGGGISRHHWDGATADPKQIAARAAVRTTENAVVFQYRGERFVFDAAALAFKPARALIRQTW